MAYECYTVCMIVYMLVYSNYVFWVWLSLYSKIPDFTYDSLLVALRMEVKLWYGISQYSYMVGRETPHLLNIKVLSEL